MKKTIALLALLAVNMLAMAQAAGGQVKRPVTSKSNKNSVQKQKKYVMSQADRDRIIQNLINNMVYVEGGTFRMSDFSRATLPESYQVVTLSSFFIAKYEVTQEEWQAVMGNNPSIHKGGKLPVYPVSWEDCQIFINRLNNITGKSFRLPTEAQWEYAARGGNQSHDYKYAGSNCCDSVAWYYSNSNQEIHVVGQKQPNELGLYDMSGNVEEWCQDYYGVYSNDKIIDPKGPTIPDSNNDRVSRGGSITWSELSCEIRYRSCNTARARSYGLRLALQ